MPGPVLKNLLVGIGFQYDRRGAEEAQSGVNSIASSILQVGAVLAGGVGFKALTVDFARARDELGKFSETFGVTAGEVLALGTALEAEGGTVDGFLSQLENIERARARILTGDVGFFEPAARAGIDPNIIANAENATEAYLALADVLPSLNQQQRLNVGEALGIDTASIRLLSRGREEVDEIIARFREIRPVTDQSTEAAARLRREWVEVQANVSGVTDAIGGPLVSAIADATSALNDFFDQRREGRLQAITDLTAALFNDVSPEQVAESSGLPEWFFTPIDQLLPQNVNDAIGSGIANTLAFLGNDEAQAAVDATNALEQTIQVEQPPAPAAEGNLSRVDFATSRREAIQRVQQPQQPRETNVNVTLELDGRVLGQQTVRVIDEQAQTALEDLRSSTEA